MASNVKKSCGLRIIKRDGTPGRRFSFPERNFVLLGSHQDNDICIKSSGIADFAAVLKNDHGEVKLIAVNQQLSVPNSSVGVLNKREDYVLEDDASFFIGERLFKIEIVEEESAASSGSKNSTLKRSSGQSRRSASSTKKIDDPPHKRKNGSQRRTSLLVTEHTETEIQAPVPRVLPKEQDRLSAMDICSVIERHTPPDKHQVKTPQSAGSTKVGGMVFNLSYASEDDSESTAIDITDSHSSDVRETEGAEQAFDSVPVLVKKVKNDDGPGSNASLPSKPPTPASSKGSSEVKAPRNQILSKPPALGHSKPSGKSASAAKKPEPAKVTSSSKMGKYERMSNGMPATPLLTRACTQFVKRKAGTPSVSTINMKGPPSARARSDSLKNRAHTPTGALQRKISMQSPASVPSTNLPRRPSLAAARPQEQQGGLYREPLVRRSSIKKSGIVPSGPSPSPRKKEVNFASRELEPGSHYTPLKDKRASPATKPSPRQPPSISNPNSLPKPSPRSKDNNDVNLRQEENEPPNAKLAVLGKFYNVKPPIDETLRESARQAAENINNEDSNEAHSSADPQPTSRISALWRRLSGGSSNPSASIPDSEKIIEEDESRGSSWTDEEHTTQMEGLSASTEGDETCSTDDSFGISTPTLASVESQQDPNASLTASESQGSSLSNESCSDPPAPGPVGVEYDDDLLEESNSDLDSEDLSADEEYLTDSEELDDELNSDDDSLNMEHENMSLNIPPTKASNHTVEAEGATEEELVLPGSRRSSGRLSIADKIAAAARAVTEKYLPAGHDFMRRLSGIPDSESELEGDMNEKGTASKPTEVDEDEPSYPSEDLTPKSRDSVPSTTVNIGTRPDIIGSEEPSQESKLLGVSNVLAKTNNGDRQSQPSELSNTFHQEPTNLEEVEEEMPVQSKVSTEDKEEVPVYENAERDRHPSLRGDTEIVLETKEHDREANNVSTAVVEVPVPAEEEQCYSPETPATNNEEPQEDVRTALADSIEQDVDQNSEELTQSLLNGGTISVGEIKACLGRLDDDASGSKKDLLSRLSNHLLNCRTTEDVMVFTMENMKSCLRDMDLAITGNKAALAKRLLEHVQGARMPSEDLIVLEEQENLDEAQDGSERNSPEFEESAALEKYQMLTVAQLRAICAAHDIAVPAKWRKNDIITALLGSGIDVDDNDAENDVAEIQETSKKTMKTPTAGKRSARKTPRSTRAKKGGTGPQDEGTVDLTAVDVIDLDNVKTPSRSGVEANKAVRRSTRGRTPANRSNNGNKQVSDTTVEGRRSTRARANRAQSKKEVELEEGEIEGGDNNMQKSNDDNQGNAPGRTLRGGTRGRNALEAGKEKEVRAEVSIEDGQEPNSDLSSARKARSGRAGSSKPVESRKGTEDGANTGAGAVRRVTRSNKTDSSTVTAQASQVDSNTGPVRRSNRRKA